VSILPSRGHVIFTGRPSQYQGSIAKHFADKAERSQPVYFRDLSGEAIPLDASHERLTIAQAMLQGKPHALVITAAHRGISEPLDLEGFEGVACIWECKQAGQSLRVTLIELWPATGREVILEGTQEPSGIAWHETNAPEPAPIQRQRTGTNDRGNGGLIDPNTRTQLSEWISCAKMLIAGSSFCVLTPGASPYGVNDQPPHE
jgi:hypothetical protein